MSVPIRCPMPAVWWRTTVVATRCQLPSSVSIRTKPWTFIEWVTREDNNIKFANRFDRVPVRISSTNSDAYIQGDAAKKLQAQEMTKRRFVIAAPGGREALKHQNVSTPVIKGEASVKDALDEGVRLTNEVLAKFRRQAEERGL